MAKKERRPWGSFYNLEEGLEYKVKTLVINPRSRISLQLHQHRDEVWVVVSGRGRVIKGNKVFGIDKKTCPITIHAGVRHKISNPFAEPLIIAEVQRGKECTEEDIIRIEDDYQR